MTLSLGIIIAFILLIIFWNTHKKTRQKMKGKSTIVEGLLGTAMVNFGVFAEGLKDAKAQGLIPDGLEDYAPLIIFAWIVVKRAQTKTPMGREE
jgi:hypothetical protein